MKEAKDIKSITQLSEAHKLHFEVGICNSLCLQSSR